MNKLCGHFLLFSLIAIIATGNVFAQKGKKNKTSFRLEYFNNYDKTENVVATLRFKQKRYLPLVDATVQFFSVTTDSRILLTEIKTDKAGQAIFVIGDNPKVFKDSLGYMTFEVEFAKSDTLKGSKKKISVKKAHLDMSFYQKDSIKFIDANVSEMGLNGDFIPITNVDVLFYIKGTFSLLPIGEGSTDENGKTSLAFPVEMPGDSLGKLTIVSKIEEHNEYGTIESKGEINWGIPVPLIPEKQRGLGDTDAPLWMVYTLITLLSLVWFHYLYVIFLIARIKFGKRIKDVNISI